MALPPHFNNLPLDVRRWSTGRRAQLDVGRMVTIVNSDDYEVAEIRYSVFSAMTTSRALCVGDTVRLPKYNCRGKRDIDDAIRNFVSYISKLTSSRVPVTGDAYKVRSFDLRQDLHCITNKSFSFQDMCLTYAGDLLGMRMYTSHIFSKYRTALTEEELPYGHLLGLVKGNNPSAERLYYTASYQLVKAA